MSKIIMIGGPPRCAKTTLAKELAGKLNCSWISADAIDEMVKEYIDPDQIATLFPKTALRKKSGGGNDEMYSKFSVEEIVNAYQTQAETVSKAVKSLVRYAIKDDRDYVIEGYHVTPKLIADLTSKDENISGLIVINSDGSSSVQKSMESNNSNDWLRDGTSQKETLNTPNYEITSHFMTVDHCLK